VSSRRFRFKSFIGRIACFLRLHSWEDVWTGCTSILDPSATARCRRCGLIRWEHRSGAWNEWKDNGAAVPKEVPRLGKDAPNGIGAGKDARF
jgi:hypothetical protein